MTSLRGVAFPPAIAVEVVVAVDSPAAAVVDVDDVPTVTATATAAAAVVVDAEYACILVVLGLRWFRSLATYLSLNSSKIGVGGSNLCFNEQDVSKHDL